MPNGCIAAAYRQNTFPCRRHAKIEIYPLSFVDVNTIQLEHRVVNVRRVQAEGNQAFDAIRMNSSLLIETIDIVCDSV